MSPPGEELHLDPVARPQKILRSRRDLQQKGYIRRHTSVRLPETGGGQPVYRVAPRAISGQSGARSALCAADDAQIGAPRANFVTVLSRQRSRDLDDMIEVVRDPGREKLPQRDRSELGMTSLPVEIGV